MNIICVDDERIGLASLVESVKAVIPESVVYEFSYAEDALKAVENGLYPDIAFMDIKMRGMSGIKLAQKIKIIHPKSNIIFVTGFNEYQGEAFELHASGYIMKPVTEKKVLIEIENLRHPVENLAYVGKITNADKGSENNEGGKDPQALNGGFSKEGVDITVKAFGNFEIFADGKPMKFRYEKTREMIAYLVDRQGALCSNGELTSNLWEDDINHNSYLRGLRKDFIDAFDAIGRSDVINCQRGRIGINVNAVSCDYYEFIRGNISAINKYRGEYMSQYSWGEMTNASLSMENRIRVKKI